MKIKLFATLDDSSIEASVNGDVITINGEKIDLSGIPQGFRLPGSAVGNKFFVDSEFIERVNGELCFTLILPVKWETPDEYRNPTTPLVISIKKGVVPFPDTTPPEPKAPEITEGELEVNQNG